MNEHQLLNPLPQFLEVKEAAALLRVSRRTIYDWVSQRKIPFRKADDRIFFGRERIADLPRGGADYRIAPRASAEAPFTELADGFHPAEALSDERWRSMFMRH